MFLSYLMCWLIIFRTYTSRTIMMYYVSACQASVSVCVEHQRQLREINWVCKWMSQSVNQTVSESVCQSVNLSRSHPNSVRARVGQVVCRWMSQPVSLLVSFSISYLDSYAVGPPFVCIDIHDLVQQSADYISPGGRCSSISATMLPFCCHRQWNMKSDIEWRLICDACEQQLCLSVRK